MARTSVVLSLSAAGLLIGAVALAADWGSYESAFPVFPCHDGWMACYQGGDRVTPDLAPGPSGLPMVATARVDFQSLEATAAFSPFVTLSEYAIEAPPEPDAVAVVDEDIPPPPEPVDDPVPATVDPEPAPPQPTIRPTAEPGPTSMVRPRPTEPEPSMVRPTTPAPAPEPGPTSLVRPRPGTETPAPEPDPQPSSLVRPTTPAPAPEPEPAVAMVAPEPSGPATCDQLVRLEPAAMMGKLSNEQIACLEASLGAADKQTDKDKISRILMANAWSKGDHRAWETFVKRHLEEINQSDPDLCYKYAAYLAKGGAARAWGVIKWSDVALENRTQWVGETYKTRVYNLYKLRAAAAQDLWKAAEEKHAAAPTDETSKAVEEARGRTKTYSREWYEYAREAGKDTTKALQLCISAAGTAEFCEGA